MTIALLADRPASPAATTGPDGSFALADVPAGQYTLVFRHELFGDVERTVEVADEQTLTQDATYEKPGT